MRLLISMCRRPSSRRVRLSYLSSILGYVSYMTDMWNTDPLSSGMSKLNEYQRALAFCEANAAKTSSPEFRDLWQTIGESYALLMELEARPECFGRARGCNQEAVAASGAAQ